MKQNIAFIDLQKQQTIIKESLQKRLNSVLDHGKYIMGPEIDEMEGRLAEYVGVKHCISLSNGTDALLVPMMALGIGSGDEVITTPFTFIATAEMIALLGARPVFVDINPMTYNIEPESIKKAITKKTRAIMPVSLYGQCADMDAVNAIAGEFGLPVIEDAAQSFGATYKGKRSCGLSTVGCTSFFPSKPLGCYGDGGACFTNDDGLALRMRQIRVHGQDRRYHHPLIGLNARMDTLQAAVILAKLEIFDDEVKSRIEIGARYTELLKDRVITPYIEPFNTSVYAQYTIQVDERDHLIAKLGEAGIPTAVHYPIPLHKQPAFREHENDSLPAAEKISRRVLSLPMHPYLSAADQDFIVKNVIM
ncbi:MAG TPA: DegT/DnrJ/EryC1/StrS family aminotransferase [Spirochaetota bacterium]|nr:DegT/DnrJ/EryC1/StrS family aminotransferase [Spirochaetota bacterium]